MPVLISLLRAVNVGGNNKIKMTELEKVYNSLGFEDARTLLQTGNVVFTTQQGGMEEIASTLEAGIEDNFGFHTTVILRSVHALQALVDNLPFDAHQRTEPGKIVVMFLATTPTLESIATLNDAHTGPEEIHVRGTDVYIFYRDGIGKSKLTTAKLEKYLKTTGTARNWNTVNKLIALAASFSD